MLEVPLLAVVGRAISVADGVDHVRRRAHWVTVSAGGSGAVREVAAIILRAHGQSASAIGEVWRRWD